MQTIRTGLSRLTGWGGRHKKALIALALVLVLAAAGLTALRVRARAAASAGQTVEYVRTVTLSRGSLDEVISATGTVESADVSTVTTELKYTVQEVLVAVGDSVQEGDVICTLDTSELESQIEKVKESLADQTAQAQKQYDQAAASRDEAKYALDEAYTSYDRAQSSYNSAKSAYDTVVSQVKEYQTAYDDALAAYQQLLAQSHPGDLAAPAATAAPDTAAESQADASQAPDTAAESQADASQAPDTGSDLASQIAAAEAAVKSAETELNTMKAGLEYTAKEQAYTSAQQTLNNATSNYEQAQKTYDNAQATVDELAESLADAGSSDELEELYDQVEACTLRAKTAGKVTALDATVGSQPGATVATIQDTGSLKISISIAEYDIESVSVGLPVRITTDVTDETFTGTLSQISPTASGGGASSSQFAAEVSVDGSPEALRIGTNASVEIILSSTEDVFTVPLDAIGQDENGRDVVYLQTGTDEAGDPVFAPVEVTVGETNDYYAEVSGDELTEGAVIRAAADASAAVSQITLPEGSGDEAQTGGFAMGGMGGMAGGNMAGGDMGGRGDRGGNMGGGPMGG